MTHIHLSVAFSFCVDGKLLWAKMFSITATWFSSGLPCEIQSVSDDRIMCRTSKHQMNINMKLYPGENIYFCLLSFDMMQPTLDSSHPVALFCAVPLSEHRVSITGYLDQWKNLKWTWNKVVKITDMTNCQEKYNRVSLICVMFVI